MTAPDHSERFDFDNIPAELRERRQWVNWKAVERDGQLTKPPLNPNAPSSFADHGDPSTWGTFEQAVDTWRANRSTVEGIGFVFTNDDPYFGIDIDDIAKVDLAFLNQRHALEEEILETVETYTEFSPSGKGYHIIGRGRLSNGLDGKRSPQTKIEVYQSRRYFTFTGNVVGKKAQITDQQKFLDDFIAAFGGQQSAKELGPVSDSVEYRRTDLPDTDVILKLAIYPSLLARFNAQTGCEPGAWSETFMAIVAAIDRLTGSATQVERLVMNSPMVMKSPASASGESRIAKAERNFQHVYRQVREGNTPMLRFVEHGREQYENIQRANSQKDAEMAANAVDIWQNAAAPEFPVNQLPPAMRAYVESLSMSTGADISACAMSAIMSIAGVLDHRIKVYPVEGSDHRVGPNLWAMIVGAVSARKSAPVRASMGFLRFFDIEDHKRLQAVHDELREKGAEVPKEDFSRRRIVKDATSEALCVILSKQDQGTTGARDEIAGWMGALEKSALSKTAASQDRGIYLTGFDGEDDYEQVRISRGSTFIPHLSIGMFGGIQLDKIRSIAKSLDDDGLLQRFIPITVGRSRPSQRVLDFKQHRANFLTMLRFMNDFPPCDIQLSAEACSIYREVEADYLEMAEAGETMSDAFAGWLGKTPRRFAQFCLIFHAAGAAAGCWELTDPIRADVAGFARELIDKFVFRHGYAFYEGLVGGDKQRSLHQAVADCFLRWQRANPDQPVEMRHVQQNCRAFRSMTDQNAREELFKFFVISGWLTEIDGRKAWSITPGLADRFSAQMEARAQQVAKIQAKITGRA
ncbi:DUF3987 domain-containing protein [Mesorhizobium denitrificans]|uniref:DUF3987 domain-containing protein n=1 Tax=Mesorhizobium denitrificans TaxID=2294114 RepID=A0A371XFU5_9HYPH|nr:DUF3987 domain-containing protein [Mesorhizobium denitrificans]RFC68099.1 DUF3987 domain-containing protein [Mesorhizobium denitrificans]